MRVWYVGIVVLGAVIIELLVPGCVSTPGPVNTTCEKLDQCSCRSDDGIIDLWPLDSSSGDDPTFVNVSEVHIPGRNDSGDQFSYNPCTPFTYINCEKVALCQLRWSLHEYHNIGDHSSAQFTLNYTSDWVNYTGLVITYWHYQQEVTWNSVVGLRCDPDVEANLTEFKAYGEPEEHNLHYYFTLTSKYACPDPNIIIPTTEQEQTTYSTTESPSTSTPTPTSTSAPTPGLSGGFIVVVVLAAIGSLFLLYCFLMLVINACRGRRGCNLIPQSPFWRALLRRCGCGYCRYDELRTELTESGRTF